MIPDLAESARKAYVEKKHPGATAQVIDGLYRGIYNEACEEGIRLGIRLMRDYAKNYMNDPIMPNGVAWAVIKKADELLAPSDKLPW